MMEPLSLPSEALAMGPWATPFETLRRKWSQVPAGDDRACTRKLLDLSDADLVTAWSTARQQGSTGEAFSVRGWYHALYKDVLRGKRVLDVGSGFGLDALTFAQSGAHITCADIVPSNLEVLRRLATTLALPEVSFHLLEDFSSFQSLPYDFDVIWCQGSLINAPFQVIRQEVQALLEHLKPDGRWIELAYPRRRWEREGALPFEQWGECTDGPGTPWMEWYDLDKLQAALAPARFEVVLNLEFHNSDFNWFDLVRLPDPE